jgi:segregation and condensation protein A
VDWFSNGWGYLLSYLVHLQQFEGPLGLLLYLIRKEEMDIFDINVGEITQSYLEYIRQMKELDLEVAGEFVAMAATLIHIKSRMLLPQYNDEGETVETEDPRKELVQKLLDYQKYQEAAKKLYERPLLNRDVFTRGIREDLRGDDEGEIIIEDDGLFSLIAAYRKSVRKAVKMIHKVRPKVMSIAERVMEIKARLIVGARVLLSELVNIGTGTQRTQLLVTFLSMLELGRMGYVSIFQNETYGDIHIETKKAIERNVLERVQEFDSGDAESVAKSIINEAIEEKIDMEEAMAIAHQMVDEGQQLALGQEPEHIADLEFAEALKIGETLAPEHVATDEEIFAAELDLDTGWGNDVGEAADLDATANTSLVSTDEPPIETVATEEIVTQDIAAQDAAAADDLSIENPLNKNNDESSHDGSAEV